MLSYVYMKILESQPGRYDCGISMLSFGRSERIKRRIVADNVREGDRVLEIGCGTGTLAVLAARQGAEVFGFDVSAAMLEVARAKVDAAEVSDRVRLVEMSVSGMDELEGEVYDLVASTLVFSELSSDEQKYALRHVARVLKPGGRLVLADETVPRTLGKRLLYKAVQLPLKVLTFVLTQTTTKAVHRLPDLVREAGLSVLTESRSNLDSFISLVAKKEHGS